MKPSKWLLACFLAGATSLSAQVGPLYTQDVGGALAGTTSLNNVVFTIEGGGADIYSSSDQFRFVYEPLTGDGTIIARVTGIENTHIHAKAGVMIRATLDANSRNMFTMVHAEGTNRFQRRTTTGQTTTATTGPGTGMGQWVRLQRVGDDFTSSVSTDGVTWYSFPTVTMGALPPTIYAGLAVSSHNAAQLCTATFDNVDFPSDLNAPGTVNAFSRMEAEAYTAQSGVGIYSGGTGQKVGSIENNTWIRFQNVDFGSGAATFLASVASATSGGTIELRLGASNGTLAGTASVGGTGGWNNFTNIETSVVTGLNGIKDVYLVFKGAGTSSLLDIDYFQFAPPAATIANADVGAVGTPGAYSVAGTTFTVQGSGADIAGASDEFHYVYKPLFGDGVLTARVTSLGNTHVYAKAGVMIRESLSPDSRHFTSFIHANGGVRFQRRTGTGEQMLSSGSASSTQRWLRIQRVGNTLTSYESTNGTSWTSMGSYVWNGAPGIVYVGLAVCSHAEPNLTTAVFENVSFPTVVDSDGDQMPDAWETLYGLNPNNPADAFSDPDGDGLTNLQEFWALSSPTVSTGPVAGTFSLATITGASYELDATYGLVRLTRTGGTAAVTVNFTRSGTASTDDYILRDPAGNVLNGSMQIAAGATSVDLTLIPVADGNQEYPETLTMTLDASPNYGVGASAAGTVTLYDATDTPAHELLLVGYLTPATGVTSSASGLVQMYLNGPKTAARVTVTHTGVANQTNTYIRWGVPGGPGPELRPNLGVGTPLTNITWNIQPIAQASGQAIIDGLFQVGGKYVYVTIGTSAGDIQGVLTRRSGSINFTAPGAAPAISSVSGDELKREVARFLTQATFGPTQVEIDALVARVNSQYAGNRMTAFSAWIDEQLAKDVTKHYAYLRACERTLWAANDDWPNDIPPDEPASRMNLGRDGGSAWWCAAMQAHDQLRQRYAFALSEIFVVGKSMQPLSSFAAAGISYYDLLGENTAGNFRNLLEDVSKSPTMGEYLSHKKNRKAAYDAQGKLIASPDENYAREIMQLFSIGLVKLHPDGTLKLDATGALMPTYDNVDISNLARVFTGWSYGMAFDRNNREIPVPNTDFNAGTSEGNILYSYYPYGWIYPMRNFAVQHDTGSKTFLGQTVPAGLDGEADLDAALNIIFNHPNTAPFISRLLIQRFVTSNPSPGYIYRVAQKFENNGSGVRGDMKAVIKAVLLDYEARSLTEAAAPTFGKQKEPILRFVHMLRACGATSAGPITAIQAQMDPAQFDNYAVGATKFSVRSQEVEPKLGQFPLAAPSVFNWYLPNYAPQGPITAAGLVAPEMTATSESTTFRVINFFYQLTHSYGVDSVELNLNPLVTEYDTLKNSGLTHQQVTEILFDKLDLVLAAGSFKAQYASAATPNPRSILLNSTGSLAETYSINRVKELIYLITTSPGYVHQR